MMGDKEKRDEVEIIEEEEEVEKKNEDESERLALQLMMEEESQFLERLQNEQMRVMANGISIDNEDAALALRLLEEEEEEARAEAEMDTDSMTYDQLLDLGERIGDVKQERWRIIGKSIVASLKVVQFCSETTERNAVSGQMCLVCRFDFENGDKVKILPCKHAFHVECIDPWLQTHDTCVTCKSSIVVEKNL